MLDFGHHVIPAYLRNSENVFAYAFRDYWKDVGTVESLWEANMEFIDPNHDLNIRDDNWRVYTKNVAAPPQFLTETSSVKNAMVTDGCYVSGEVEHSILSYNVKVGKGSKIKDSFIMPGATIGENVTVDHAIIGENAVIHDGAQLIGKDKEIAVLGKDEIIGGVKDVE